MRFRLQVSILFSLSAAHHGVLHLTYGSRNSADIAQRLSASFPAAIRGLPLLNLKYDRIRSSHSGCSSLVNIEDGGVREQRPSESQSLDTFAGSKGD